MTRARSAGEAIARRWDRYWFAPLPPTDLGVGRLVFFGALFVGYLPQDLAAWAGVAGVFWRPVSFFGLAPLEPRSLAVTAAIAIAWKVALALSAIGLFTRAATMASLVGGAYLLGLPQSFGKIHHNDGILVLVMLVLAFSRCGDAFSLDRLRAGASGAAIAANGDYRWPLRTAWVVLSLVFLAAGVAKLRHAGLDWVTSDNLRLLLLAHQYHIANADPLVDWGIAIAQSGWMPRAIAAATVVLEIAFPLALVAGRARAVLVPSAIAMHLGIRALMGPTFDQLLVADVLWVPWSVVAVPLRRLGLGRAARSHPLPT